MKSLILLLSCTGLALAAAPSDPVVSVTGGQIQGRVSAAGAAFKGIPFAHPPVGDLRWREPAPVKPWDGIRDAGAFGAPCAQTAQGWNDAAAAAGKEDCLYLNVWTAEWPSKTPKPVMVWIHGGGNTGGSATGGMFDQGFLTARGVILVTLHYRLGALGFLAHPELTAEPAHQSSGNYALLDQIAALKWVKANIAQFGGDPGNITLFGQSAGAQDLGLLMTSPLARGLFHRAIAESGTVIIDGRLTMSRAEAERAGAKFAAAVNAPDKDTLRYLRGLPAEEILKATQRGYTGGPNVDGWVLPALPAAVFAAGDEMHVPLIIGNNGRERSFKGTLEEGAKLIERRYAAAGLKLYMGQDTPYPPYGTPADQLSTDTSFRCTAVGIAKWHAAAGNLVYQYEFNHADPARGAAHSAELRFVFGGVAANAPAAERKTAGSMRDYWTNFARSGDPNSAGLPAWPKYDVQQQPYVDFTAEGPKVKANLRRPFCELFEAEFQRRLPR